MKLHCWPRWTDDVQGTSGCNTDPWQCVWTGATVFTKITTGALRARPTILSRFHTHFNGLQHTDPRSDQKSTCTPHVQPAWKIRLAGQSFRCKHPWTYLHEKNIYYSSNIMGSNVNRVIEIFFVRNNRNRLGCEVTSATTNRDQGGI